RPIGVTSGIGSTLRWIGSPGVAMVSFQWRVRVSVIWHPCAGWLPSRRISAHFFDLARPPGLVEPRLGGAVETQEGKPSFARNCLEPVVLLVPRRRGAEVEVHGPVGVGRQFALLAVPAGKRLAGLQLRARLRVVEDHRPEVL